MDIQDDLKRLGLTFNQIKVYQSLIRLGETPVGGLIDDLKIHRQIAYNALQSLEKKGMISRKVKNKINHYKIGDPDAIVENAKKREVSAKRVSDLVKKELKKSKHEHEINIFEGRAQIRRFFVDMYKKCPIESEFCILAGTVGGFGEAVGKRFLKDKLDKLREKKKVKSKMITDEKFKKEAKEFYSELNQELREIRYLSYEEMAPVTTIILPFDVVVHHFFKEDIPYAIEIRNKNFRDANFGNFNVLWKIAKK